MKHNAKITAILVAMFIITQLVGLFIVTAYHDGIELPYGMEPPENINPNNSAISIIFAFVIAITLFILLTRIRAETFIRLWFFIVVILALGLAFNVFLIKLSILFYPQYIALIIALPLALIKIFQRNIIVHNITELLIYPGIAAVFIPILNVFWVIILLLMISLYDIWAVWKSDFMQKMAKYQINNLRFFTGFFVPYAGKKAKLKIKQLTQKYGKRPKLLEKHVKKSRIKINLAILGGGDIIFPIITAGVFYKAYGIIPAFIIMLAATLALISLFVLARKGKFYPAMPFLSIGMFLGMIVSWLIF